MAAAAMAQKVLVPCSSSSSCGNVQFSPSRVHTQAIAFGGGLSQSSSRKNKSLALKAVAAKGETSAPVTAKSGHEILLFDALREGLEEEMARDPTVCVMGEDVGHYGGSYKVTKGLAEKFGDLRVLDTPICENSFTGMGIGAAMTGLRTVVEGMNMGFLLLAYNQISNNAGMLHYTSGGQFKIPVVIRGPGGVGKQLGAEHSQRLESYFQSVPGLQMVACSTPYNAKGLMKAAIRSDNPVILYEHVLLYNLKERIPDEEYVLCLEEAELVRPGKDITILTYSRMRHFVLQAAKTLVERGYDPEIIDIRSLKPFDLFTIGNSIKKTHKVLIVEECMRTGGIGASLRAAIVDNFWDFLDGRPECLSSQDVPTPYAATLEDATVVQPAQIIVKVEQMLQGLI
ncbi:pyruvate dehydrogenase E1 component subunit beta [Selaginella moellendorffii]|nr:pyruvate dehydrogenase E1 component subunit beta [Selaginella moellendorffii]|eukprot:XP_002979774.2 pyruvate dehydrogenase E1 component subunit beta [Selaginella moellendorffii]